jgi:hypothetical protein
MNEADTGEKAIGYEKFLSQSARKKTSEGLAALSASHKENILNSDGGLNELGSNSLEASTRKSISEQKGRYLNANNKDTVNDITAEGVKRTYYGALEETGSPEEALKSAIKFAEFFQATDEKGKKKGEIKINPETGELNKELYEPVLGGGYLSKLGEAEGNNMTDKMGRSVINGMAYNLAKGQVSAKKDNSVTTNSLVSDISGNKKEENENVEIKNVGEDLNYNPLIDFLGNDTVGEIAKGVLQGAVVLGALDTLTGGKVRDRIASAKEAYFKKTREKKNIKTGHVDGKGDDRKEKTFNPKSPTDVDEYLDNNKGAKSRVNYSPSGREPSEPKKPVIAPQSAAPTQSTTNSNPAETKADDIGTPSSKNNNTIITENAEKLNQNNSGSKEILKNALNKELTNLEANPGSDADAYAKKKYDLNNELKKLNEGGKVNAYNLKNLGINTKDLGLELGDYSFGCEIFNTP